jgi:hypothetical protein
MNDSLPLNIPFLELQSRHCREVTGTGDDGLALYCGKPKSGRTSYCAQHRRINLVMVVQGPRTRGGPHFIPSHGEEPTEGRVSKHGAVPVLREGRRAPLLGRGQSE